MCVADVWGHGVCVGLMCGDMVCVCGADVLGHGVCVCVADVLGHGVCVWGGTWCVCVWGGGDV